MATEVIMPQMGESIAEGTITRWLVKEGDRVERDQPLFEISTDKVDAEIPSPADGVLLEIRNGEGDTVAVNEVVALIGEKGEETGAEERAEAEGAEDQEADAAAQEAAAADEEEKGEKEKEEKEEKEEAEAEEAEEEEGEREEPAEEATEEPSEAERVRTFSSPVVRKMAAEHGVDLSKIEGSGIHGRVTKRDLEAHLEGEEPEKKKAEEPKQEEPREEKREEEPDEAVAEAALERTGAPTQRPVPEGFYVPPYTEDERVEIVPMTKIRQITSAHMTYSKATSAHVTTVFHMDLARVHRAREKAKAAFLKEHGTKLTYMPFIFKAVATALKANPKLNAAVDGTNIVYKKDINIGMAVALDWGLLVPVIRDADQLNLVGLAKTANDLADRARAKKLNPDELRGGTFTITNPGVFGTLFGTPIINQPQVAILGLGTIEKRPVVETDAQGNDTIVIKPMSYFAISYDHRLVDGADADHFMNHVKRTLVEETWSELDAFE